MKGRFWTEAEEITLREMVEAGLGDVEVGKALTRSRSAVCVRRNQLGMYRRTGNRVNTFLPSMGIPTFCSANGCDEALGYHGEFCPVHRLTAVPAAMDRPLRVGCGRCRHGGVGICTEGHLPDPVGACPEFTKNRIGG